MGICWTTIVNALQQSERLLDATLRSYEQAIGQIKEQKNSESLGGSEFLFFVVPLTRFNLF